MEPFPHVSAPFCVDLYFSSFSINDFQKMSSQMVQLSSTRLAARGHSLSNEMRNWERGPRNSAIRILHSALWTRMSAGRPIVQRSVGAESKREIEGICLPTRAGSGKSAGVPEHSPIANEHGNAGTPPMVPDHELLRCIGCGSYGPLSSVFCPAPPLRAQNKR